VGGVYLRGKVLERYRARYSGDGNTAVWNSSPPGTVSEPRRLPIEYLPERRSDENFYDTVDVTVISESMRSKTLFAIAPYHQSRTSSELKHTPELWTVSRRGKVDWVFPRIEYHFGTHAFRSGIQSPLITYRGESASEPGKLQVDRLGARYRRLQEVADQRRQQRYRSEILEFDRDAMPTAAELASTFVRDSNGQRRRDYAIAKAMERHFLTSNRYEYTLNLNAESIPGLDPIEQFLRVDRRGHCQYFASALAMMLRSQGIPARLVAGYQTDEYNPLGNHYVARQLHAHAWVEALIDRDQLGAGQVIYGQQPSSHYWLRLDPTPPAGRIRESSPGVGQVLDMARNIWDDYVVEMDAERQKQALIGGGSNPMNRSYQRFVDRLSLAVSRIRAGELGGGALAWRNIFSWQAAVMAALLALVLGLLVRVRPPAWIRRRLRKGDPVGVAEPSLAFYADALRQLERTGLVREASQTPGELAEAAEVRFRDLESDLACKSFHFLTDAFYRHRYGPATRREDLETIPSIGDAHRHEVASHPNRVVQALADLTQEVDLIVNQQNEAEQAT
jgi:transglutaminase-like putative cysteine protease